MKAFAVPGVAAVLSAALCAGSAFAQSAAPVPAPAAAPLQLQLPAQPVREAPPAASDNAIVDAQDSAAANDDDKRGPQIHGSFTTGIGYSKGYGTSTMNAADLDISGQTDSGRSYDVQLHVMKSNGPGFDPYGGYYGPRYR